MTAEPSNVQDKDSTPTAVPRRTSAHCDRLLNAMTVDVEDYFQVEAFSDILPRDMWERLPSRVEQNTDRLLELFADAGAKATFFVLGWVALRHPELIKRIVAGGHELASHGFHHIRADRQTAEEFRSDVRRTKLLLEDLGGVRVLGYRAATFSIRRENWWVFDVLADEGYAYSSSVFPIAHDLYGLPDAPRAPFYPNSSRFLEIPLTTVRLFGKNLPCAGGGYFRLLPYTVSRWGFSRVNQRERRPCVFYCHPWEIDPDQPRQKQAPMKSQIRHYMNLTRTQNRLCRLLRDFSWGRMDAAFLETESTAGATRQDGHA